MKKLLRFKSLVLSVVLGIAPGFAAEETVVSKSLVIIDNGKNIPANRNWTLFKDISLIVPYAALNIIFTSVAIWSFVENEYNGVALFFGADAVVGIFTLISTYNLLRDIKKVRFYKV
ncbi:MAG: hypothetical protein RsTaC01_0013 [Candidatus Paraimprobicoccus trichonymphae]|uniref:Uncharacterized protein n=1 Tax=Candidatus Paraimprobicoccus trichonymphae TaxID=3033793 RepID=A0AA48HZ07_9FIRM|nr:MAG: hypothetical protein RsTaC01_0013 [Candidatus Paraimprobicoccus trichonymphae]